MSELTIKTNNVPRLLIYGYQLSEKEKKEFDYIKEDFDTHDFFRYKGVTYDAHELMPTSKDAGMDKWDGYIGDSFFSGIVVRFVEGERVICGTYFS